MTTFLTFLTVSLVITCLIGYIIYRKGIRKSITESALFECDCGRVEDEE